MAGEDESLLVAGGGGAAHAAQRAGVDERLPWGLLLLLGLQHVLAMYAGAVAVPLLVGNALGFSQSQQAFLIRADLFTCGVATLLQALGVGRHIGIRMPVLLGVSFVAVGPVIAIGKHLGIEYKCPAFEGATEHEILDEMDQVSNLRHLAAERRDERIASLRAQNAHVDDSADGLSSDANADSNVSAITEVDESSESEMPPTEPE